MVISLKKKYNYDSDSTSNRVTVPLYGTKELHDFFIPFELLKSKAHKKKWRGITPKSLTSNEAKILSLALYSKTTEELNNE